MRKCNKLIDCASYSKILTEPCSVPFITLFRCQENRVLDKQLLPHSDCSWKSLDASSLWRHHSAWRFLSLAEGLSRYCKWSAIAASPRMRTALQSSFDLLNLQMGGWTYHSCHVSCLSSNTPFSLLSQYANWYIMWTKISRCQPGVMIYGSIPRNFPFNIYLTLKKKLHP